MSGPAIIVTMADQRAEWTGVKEWRFPNLAAYLRVAYEEGWQYESNIDTRGYTGWVESIRFDS